MVDMEPSNFVYRAINSEIDRYSKDNSISTQNRAFLEYVLENFLDLSRDEVIDAVVDGSNDRGIDAVHIGDDELGRTTVYLVQSKFYNSADKWDRSFEGDALIKMQTAIQNLIWADNFTVYNEFLENKIRDIRNLLQDGLPRFEIIFCGNSMPPDKKSVTEFEKFINKRASGYFSFRYIMLAELAQALAPTVTKRIDTKLPFVGSYINLAVGGASVLVGRVYGRELAELCLREGKDLFERNVRGYLSVKKNTVNEDIYDSATNEIESKQFFFLNNGVTIVCDELDFVPVDCDPNVVIKNLQIVNGGQTTNTITEAYRKKLLGDSLTVLVKVIATKDKDLVTKITETTNRQTSITARDLRSNDPVQKMIKRVLRNKDYFYETRKNEFKSNPAAKGKRIDMEVATQAYYSLFHEQPADAKNKKRDLFGDLYGSIFGGEGRVTIADDMLLAFQILDFVRKSNQTLKNEFSFARYAELHAVAILGKRGVYKYEDLVDESVIQLYRKFLDATNEVVLETIEELGDAYSHRALFIDPKTLGRIDEAFIDLS